MSLLAFRAERGGRLSRTPRYLIAIYGERLEPMPELVNKHRIEVLDHGSSRIGENLYRAYAITDPTTIERLTDVGYEVEQLDDVDATAEARRAEVGVRDRFCNRGER